MVTPHRRQLTRTQAGFANYPLFFKENIMLFVEGTPSKSNTDADDVFFWTTLAKRFAPLKNIKVKPCGSKTKLLQILDTVSSRRTIKRIFIAVDSDYDVYHENYAENKNLLFTYGYSYENDLVELSVLESFLTVCVRDIKKHEAVVREFKLGMHEFSRKTRWAICADILLHKTGISIINKQAATGMLFTMPQNRGKPDFTLLHARGALKNARKTPRSPVRTISAVNPILSCKGKIVLHYIYLLSNHIIGSHSSKSTHGLKERIKTALFFNLSSDTCVFSAKKETHYRNMFSKM